MNLLRRLCIVFCFFTPALFAAESMPQLHQPTSCVASGSWLVPGTPDSSYVSESSILAQASASRVVLLGEHHDNQAHHVWQLQMLQKLHQRQPNLVMGLEMLPHVVQPAIDRYLRGEGSIETFLKAVEWERHWSFSADYYTPLLEYAREQKIAVRALNVSRESIDAAVAQGWDAAPPGMTQPAAATRPYLRHLVMSFQRHKLPGAKLDMAVEGPAFRRFVQKQMLWDRAMAEGIRAQLSSTQPPPLVVAFIGSGHLMHGYGVPHQLQAMAIKSVMTMIPWDSHLDCGVLVAGFADVVYGAE